MGPVIPDNCLKFGDPRMNMNLSREIPPEAARGGIFDDCFRCSFRPEVVSDVISPENVGRVGMDMPVSGSNGSRDIQQRSRRMRHFRPFSNFDNCQPEVVMADQDVGLDVCANCSDSMLKPSEASFSTLFRTSITSDWMYIL